MALTSPPLTRAQDPAARLSSFCALSTEISQADSCPEVFSRVYEYLARDMGASGLAYLVVSSDGSGAHLEVAYGDLQEVATPTGGVGVESVLQLLGDTAISDLACASIPDAWGDGWPLEGVVTVRPAAGPGADPVGFLIASGPDGLGGDRERDALLRAVLAQTTVCIRDLCQRLDYQQRLNDLDRVQRESEARVEQLRSLHQAGVLLAQDLELDEILTRVLEEARKLTSAEHAALGILDSEGDSLKHFIAVGMDETEQARIGEPPTGHGILGAVIREKRSIRIDDLSKEEGVAGVPEHHFQPTSFLGVPIRVGDSVYGNLYLTHSGSENGFSDQDQQIVEMLAASAAVAVENARLFEEKSLLIQKLQAANRTRRRFDTYVHHDLRNALQGVSLWAERLERSGGPNQENQEERDSEVPEIARKIRSGGEHALRLASDLLDLARLEEGRLQTWPRRLRVVDVVTAATDSIAPEAERRQIEIDTAPVQESLELVADTDRVRQIVLNLLSNAVKFSLANSVVSVSAAVVSAGPRGEEGGWVRIQIADQGAGIEPDDLERIFGEFEQLDAEAGRPGAGVGLTLSRHLADHMGGALTVESVVGVGSTFTLWLPHGREPETREGWIG